MALQKRPRKPKSHIPRVAIDPSEDRRLLDFRPLGFRDVVVLGRYDYAKAHPALAFHSHGKMIEICYVERGQQTYYVDAEPFHLHGGDLFVTLPNERHGSDTLPEGKGVLYWLLIRVPGRNGRLLSLPPAQSRMVVDRLLHLPARRFAGGQRIPGDLRRILATFGHEDDALRVMNLQNLLLRFVLDVLEASRGAQRGVTPQIQAIQQSIAENLDQPLPIAALAKMAHLSESRFKARFKAEVGIPPADYAMRQRIELAKQLLRRGDLSVTRIAMRLSFGSTQYFATVFKRYVGQTPSGFRRRNRDD